MQRNEVFGNAFQKHHIIFFLRQKYKDCADEWRQAVRQNEILVEERVVAANNLGAFYKYVYKRTIQTNVALV